MAPSGFQVVKMTSATASQPSASIWPVVAQMPWL